ncbi:sigma-54-dependent transcriptional regulator [Desulforhopalus singaporensis]|uniref:Two-component system, NtrC family, response regulator n=1 Tax=Desulforhopalus singaporensis TaxID=91360 RepID=A0A1H0SC55_9BACT|nr:sigma-54 dependent transcriptional regulator [Desulforhopalus singaporensis]SDP39391.1 two-component system, NtrC family, response regulator [Desulforhopalus singaporensis]
MSNVLIVDDDESMCQMLVDLVESLEHNAVYALTLTDGIRKARHGNFDIVLLDVNMPDGSGLKIIDQVREVATAPEVIIITGAGDADGAELAIRNGAWDYLQKPISLKKILLPLKRALQYRDSLEQPLKVPILFKREEIVGDSPKMTTCLQDVVNAASTSASVLITGETGTGKELISRAIHENSARAKNNFVVVDCANLSESLSASQLFGYKKGTFTGAETSSNGLIMYADRGTLFLDEVAELSLDLQKIFLRVLQERRYRPLGSKKEFASDFRLISATNKNLDHLVSKGLFRDDLLFRLRTLSIHVPPLRQRIEDIKKIILFHGLSIFSRYGLEVKGFSPDFLEVLCSYPWPGNVRELINALEFAIHKGAYEPVLYPHHLPEHIRVHQVKSSVEQRAEVEGSGDQTQHQMNFPDFPKYKKFREAVLVKAEKEYFRDLMQLTRGDIKTACRLTGLGRTRLYALLKKYSVSRTGWDS